MLLEVGPGSYVALLPQSLVAAAQASKADGQGSARLHAAVQRREPSKAHAAAPPSAGLRAPQSGGVGMLRAASLALALAAGAGGGVAWLRTRGRAVV